MTRPAERSELPHPDLSLPSRHPIVVVPGLGGSGDRHWQSLWRARWGGAATTIEPASWWDVDPDDWMAATTRAAGRFGDEPVVLVAHSLGCSTAVSWALRHPTLTAAVFLVAPPDPKGPHFPEEARDFVLPADVIPAPSVVVASTDDLYCTERSARAFAAAWGSDLVVVGAAGHINGSSGLGEWPEGRRLLNGLLVRV